jgi:alanine racemase
MLENNFHTSHLEIDSKAVKNNVKFIRRIIGKDVKLSAVAKGNAYGHGIEQVIPLFEENGITHISVFSAQEALRVQRIKQPETEIMIMGWIGNDHLKWAIEHDIEFFVFELDRLQEAIKIAKSIGKKAKVHIELETGMNRTGLERIDIPTVLELLKNHRTHVTLQGLCTHYAGAESISNYLRIQEQIQSYQNYVELFKKNDLEPKLKHTACSAASIAFPETHMDMVRIGILLYGLWPSRETFISHLRMSGKSKSLDPLKRVISWKSVIMSTKIVEMGDFIGYGTSYQAPKEMKIATVPVGYSYGFTRSLSNQGRVIVKGKRVAVIGIVNMNLMIINVSEIDEVEKGEEVVIIGKQKKSTVTIASFGELSNQLNYELLSRLPVDLPRIVK